MRQGKAVSLLSLYPASWLLFGCVPFSFCALYQTRMSVQCSLNDVCRDILPAVIKKLFDLVALLFWCQMVLVDMHSMVVRIDDAS